MRTPLFDSSGDLLADKRYAFAVELVKCGELQAATDLLVQTIAIAPNFASAWFALGELREQVGDRTGATEAFQAARACDLSDRHGATLHLVRIGAQAAQAMPPAYVEALFEQYAPGFDAALAGLSYRGPELLLGALRQACRAAGRELQFGSVLDLGCGTGLAGAAIRPFCDWLAGVDLSRSMVALARAKGVYDRLEVAEITSFLAAERGAQYHLMLAADVLPYFADLTAIFSATASLLPGDGLFAFTVETHPAVGVALGTNLRFAHGAPYVHEATARAGLVLRSLVPTSTRTEAGAPVAGLLAVACPALDPLSH